MSTVSLAASDPGAAVRIDRLFLGLALGATVVLIALVLLDQQPASAALRRAQSPIAWRRRLSEG